MSCTVIPPVHPNPFLHNNIINALQSAMETTGFLSEVYPLAQTMEIEMNERRGLVPVVYGQQAVKANDYIQMFPDSGKRGVCFFEIQPGQYNLNRGTEDGDLIDIVVRAVFTANMHNIANRTYDFTDELIALAVLGFEASTVNQDINAITIITDRNLIFSKYTYDFNEIQSLLYPMTGFAIDLAMSVNYDFDCVVPGGFDESFSPEC